MRVIWLRAGFVVAFVVVAVISLPRVRFDNSLERWVPKGTDALAEYESFLDQFGGDAVLVVAFRGANDDTRAGIRRFKDQVADLEHVTAVVLWPADEFWLVKRPSEDVTAVVASFAPTSHTNPNRPDLVARVEELARDVPLESFVAGTGVLTLGINDETRRSSMRYLTVGVVVLLVLLSLILRSPRVLAYTVLVSLGGAITVLIASAVLGVPLSLITAILPVLVLFYGTSSSLHIFFHGGDFRRVLVPCLLTALTTCAGFAVFIVDPIPLLRDFALLAVIGIAGVFVWSLVVFYPRTYALAPDGRLVRFFERLPVRRGGVVLMVGVIVVGLTVPGLARVQTDIHSLAVLSPRNQRVRDHHFIEENVGNYLPLEFRVETGRVTEEQLYAWMGAVLALDEVTGALSYADFTYPDRAQDYGYATADGGEGRVTFLVPLLSTRSGLALVNRIEDLAEASAAGYRPRVTGYVTLYAQIADELHRSFIRSLLLAFALVYLVVFAYLRSPRLFLASAVPNAIPVLLVIAIMGWFGIRLDMTTVPMGCLLLGIVVDDSIHFLYWYKRLGTLGETFRRAGPGILYTSVALVSGFAVYLVSTSPPTRNFGLLGITALSTAQASVLLLLPAVLERVAPQPGVGDR